MLGITFSAEAEPSAAERISDCFQYFESRMDVVRLPRYCKVLDSIKIILSTAPDEKERKHISLKWREAEICVRLDGDTFMKASQDEQRDMVREAITRALEIIRDRSEVKNFRFECKSLLYDMFPDAYMTPFTFSTESESPAAQMIMDNFCLIEKNMRVTSLAKYTDVLDSIGIIPECLSEEFLRTFDCGKDRKYISWKKRYADIRLRVPFLSFVQAPKEERMERCKQIIRDSLEVVAARCRAKKLRFDLDELLRDLFPEEAASMTQEKK